MDGSNLKVEAEQVVDSLRGKPGYFVPVADMKVEKVSEVEAAAYHDFIAEFQREIGQMPPIAVGIQRTPREEGGQSMDIEVHAEPLRGVKLGSLRDILGSPSAERLQPVAGDVVALEAVLDIPVPLIGGEKQPHHLFAALRDFRSMLAVEGGAVILSAGPAEFVRGYLGAWPRPGLLELIAGSVTTGGQSAGNRSGTNSGRLSRKSFS